MQKIGFVLAGGLGRRMGGDLPKVLYRVEGKAMVVRALDALRDSGIERLIAVLSHRSDETASVLPPHVEVVVQERPRGTASAIIAAQHYLTCDDTVVVVAFGDMPWLNPNSAARLCAAIHDGAHAAVFTYHFDDPPQFGRIIRDRDGHFVDIVEYKDCTAKARALCELNAGMFAFQSGPLREALAYIDDNNAAGEQYLTDVPRHIARTGHRVATVVAEGVEETLGVNDPKHLEFARLLPLIRRSEKRLYLAAELYEDLLDQAA